MSAVVDPELSKPKPKRTLSLTSPPQYVDEVITISPVARSFIWVTVLSLVVFNAALLGVFAVVYMQNEKRGSLLWLFRIYFLFSNGNAFLMNYSTLVASGYAILCAVFSLVALRLVWTSVVSGRLRFGSTHMRGSISRTLSSMTRSQSFNSKRVKAAAAKTSAAVQWIQSLSKRWHRAVGVRGPYFDLRLLAEEIFEVATQTVAALSASQSISNVPLNIIYAVVIFLNSIASFVFRRLFRNSLVKQRIACLLTDLVLDFVWGTLLPIWMYLPIVKIWLDRDNVLEYVDNFANSTREVERVLIISWKLYALSVIPFCNSLLNLLEVHSILREITPKRSSEPVTQPQGTRTILQLRYPVGRVRAGFLMRLAHAVLPLYGIAVLIMTLMANGVFRAVPQSNQFGCMHRVNPWFSTKEACLGRQINCSALNIEGSQAELDQALELFDRSSLADLFLISCPKLVIPPKIQSFNRLMTIVIKDSTVVEWSEAAMLRGEFFKELRTIQLNGVAFLQDPVGLIGVGQPISSSVEWIHLDHIDGSHLLSLVGDHWKGLLFFDCMSCGLTAFPDVLYHMPKLTMVLATDNQFPTIPGDWIPNAKINLQMLSLDGNPMITELPDSLWRQAKTCSVFSASSTNLSLVPEWIADVAGPDFLLTAIGTPLCDNFQALSARVQPLVVCE